MSLLISPKWSKLSRTLHTHTHSTLLKTQGSQSFATNMCFSHNGQFVISGGAFIQGYTINDPLLSRCALTGDLFWRVSHDDI